MSDAQAVAVQGSDTGTSTSDGTPAAASWSLIENGITTEPFTRSALDTSMFPAGAPGVRRWSTQRGPRSTTSGIDLVDRGSTTVTKLKLAS